MWRCRLPTSEAFSNRLLAYLARVYSEQLKIGDDYKKLRPAYSLAFIKTRLHQFKSLDEYYHVCRLQRIHSPHLTFSEGMQFVVVELGKFKKKLEELLDPERGVVLYVKKIGRYE